MPPLDGDYLEDVSPGTGVLPPRASFRSDAPRLSLDGIWRFRLSDTAAPVPDGFQAPDFDDSDWSALPVFNSNELLARRTLALARRDTSSC